jgi:uncharacterized protein
MKHVFVLLLFIITFSGVNAQQEKQKKYDSFWEGNLVIDSARTLRLEMKTIRNADGTISGFLDSPDQNAFDIPMTKIKVTSDSLMFEVQSLGISYSGRVMKESMVVVGKFKQGMANLDLNLKRVIKQRKKERPQTPEKPYPYNDEEITFVNTTSGDTLAGSFTFPKEEGKYPAVVLVTGSGGQDRDEMIFNHRPFLVIADYLTRNGIAVLRYDDRGIGKSTGNYAAATTEDLATDALAAVQYLKLRKEVDAKQIGIIGHSEGGEIAPMVAVNSNDVAFIILLAAPGVGGKDLLMRQTDLILRTSGGKEEDIKNALEQNRKAYEAIVSAADSLTAYNQLEEMYNKEIEGLSEEQLKSPQYSKEMFNKSVKVILSPWFRFFLKYDPRSALQNITIPVLALNGEKDLQVDPEQNLTVIEEILKNNGNKNYKVMKLPGLNHLFQTATTGSLSEYGKIKETFSPDALKIIGDWINSITK